MDGSSVAATVAKRLRPGEYLSDVRFGRQVGANGWVVLEELLLGSTPGNTMTDRVVSRATVRALAGRIGSSKDTVSRSIQKLRRAQVLDIEAERHDESGRFVSVRYLLDLSRLPLGVHHASPVTPKAMPSPLRSGDVSDTPNPRLACRAPAVVSPASPPVPEQLRMLGD